LVSSATSPRAGSRLKSGAIVGLAAMVSAPAGRARPMSAIAGNAMMASPSQLGANTTTRDTVSFMLG
jgi:hypothetical protein